MNPLQGNVVKVFAGYALPSVVGMLALSSAGIIDGIFVGNYVGSDALAAVNLVIPLISLMMGLALMLAVGGSVTVGKLLGANQVDQASSVFSHLLLVMVVGSALLTVLGLANLDTLLFALGAKEQLLGMAGEYLWVVLLFTPAYMLSVLLVYFVRIDGRPVLASIAFVFGALSNVALDWLLIAQWDQGIAGAAWATALSQLLTIAVMLPYFFTDKRRLQLKLLPGGIRAVGRSAFNGLSDFANEASAGITALLFNWIMMARFGVDGVAAFAVVNYILFTGLIISFAISDALQPIISQCFGAGEGGRIRAFLQVGFATIVAIGLSIIAVLLVLPTYLIDLFLEGDAVGTTAIATEFIAWFWPAFLFNGANICIAAYFTAMHKPVPSALIALSRSLILPCVGLLALPWLLGDNGVFVAIPLAELLTLVLAVWILRANGPAALIDKDRVAA